MDDKGIYKFKQIHKFIFDLHSRHFEIFGKLFVSTNFTNFDYLAVRNMGER